MLPLFFQLLHTHLWLTLLWHLTRPFSIPYSTQTWFLAPRNLASLHTYIFIHLLQKLFGFFQWCLQRVLLCFLTGSMSPKDSIPQALPQDCCPGLSLLTAFPRLSITLFQSTSMLLGHWIRPTNLHTITSNLSTCHTPPWANTFWDTVWLLLCSAMSQHHNAHCYVTTRSTVQWPLLADTYPSLKLASRENHSLCQVW